MNGLAMDVLCLSLSQNSNGQNMVLLTPFNLVQKLR